MLTCVWCYRIARPNFADKKKEMEQHMAIIGELPPSEASKPPRRPGYGTAGDISHLRTNYFMVEAKAGQQLFVYEVAIAPDITHKKKRKRLFEILENDPQFVAIKEHVATDCGQILVSAKILNANQCSFKVAYCDSGKLDWEKALDKDRYVFKLTLTGDSKFSDLKTFVQGSNHTYNPERIIQAMNIIFAKYPAAQDTMNALGLTKLGNKSFITEKHWRDGGQATRPLGYSLGSNLVALKGFYTSIRPCVGKIMCNINVCTTAFHM